MKTDPRHWKWIGLSLLLWLSPSIGAAIEGVHLVCDEPVYHFGRVTQSAVITHIFTIRNEGDLSFMLRYVRASCGCTKGSLDQRVIGPGETAKLTAVFRAARRKGPQKKRLTLIARNSDKPAISFYMEGFVEPSANSH